MTYSTILPNYIEYVVNFFSQNIFYLLCFSKHCTNLKYCNTIKFAYVHTRSFKNTLSVSNEVTTLLCNVLADASNSHLRCFILTVYNRANNIDSGNKIPLLSVISPSVCRTTAGVHNPDTPSTQGKSQPINSGHFLAHSY